MINPSTGGELVYAIGDVHGCYDLMKALLATIAGDCAERAQGRRPVIIFLGDYVDRGPDSAKVLEGVLWLRRRSDIDVHLLKGNHEEALLAFLDDPESAAAWLHYGGAETLSAYGTPPPDPSEGLQGLVRARDELVERMPASHLWLLLRLELMVAVGDYAFVHAGIRPRIRLADQTQKDLLWIRQDFIGFSGAHEKIIVHGHTWVDERPQIHPHRLGVDTGAYATGVLTALRLDNEESAVLQVSDGRFPVSPPAEALDVA